MKSLLRKLIFWTIGLLIIPSVQACNNPTKTQDLEFCISEELEDVYLCSNECQRDGVWISPQNTDLLFPEFGIHKQDLFIQNKDTLSGYYIHPKLVGVIGEILSICSERATLTGKEADITFNSLVRSKTYNRRIGGVSNSEHLEPLGHAVDIRFARDWRNRYYINYFHHTVTTKGTAFQRLFDQGCRSFGFYDWGIHFGVRKRAQGWRTHKGEVYAIWDKRKNKRSK